MGRGYSSIGRVFAWQEHSPEISPQHRINWAWGHVPVKRWRQEGLEFEVILSYIVSSRPGKAMWNPTSKYTHRCSRSLFVNSSWAFYYVWILSQNLEISTLTFSRLYPCFLLRFHSLVFVHLHIWPISSLSVCTEKGRDVSCASAAWGSLEHF